MSTKPDLRALEERIGRVHLRQRLGIESDHAADIIHWGRTLFHIENWYSMHGWIRLALRCAGLYRRGQRNARAIRVRRNEVVLRGLPRRFDGFTLLHVSDLHLDMSPGYPDALIDCLRGVRYDVCVLTGDYRARTYGDTAGALAGLGRVRAHLDGSVFGVLGNHDSIRMVTGMEAMGIRMLMNEAVAIERDGEAIFLAGIDDPHYFQLDNFEKAAADIPPGAVSVLLSHSPEPFRRAAHSGFSLMLSGHTHGGQICLPGGVPLMTNASCPRRFCAGRWEYRAMQGYTSTGSGASVVDARFNCPPEITLHTLRGAG